MSCTILGISAFYHDSAAALVVDGTIVAAAQEERFTRIKHDQSFPSNAAKYCMEEAKLNIEDLDHVIFYDKPLLKFERLIETYLSFAPRGFTSFRQSMPIWIKDKLFLNKKLIKELRKLSDKDINPNLLFCEHHLSHAASAFFASPFEDALVLNIDGVGEWATTSIWKGSGNSLELIKKLNFPHSLGLLYSAFTYYCGFKVNSGEYKLMGLAPYGEPKYQDLILEKIIDLKEDGSFRLNMKYFNYCTGLTMINKQFEALFGHKTRVPEEKIQQFHMDLAASIQIVLERAVISIVRSLANEFDTANLCLAGGVALNCVANGKLVSLKIFQNLWVQPAAGDAGGAIGAALAAYHIFKKQPRSSCVEEGKDLMVGSYLGPKFTSEEIKGSLKAAGAVYEEYNDRELIEKTVSALKSDHVVGWFQGRMEFGPRALGNRSILASPLSSDMQTKLNLKIKFRESFRPFAPAILFDDLQEWFKLDVASPFMLVTADIQDDKKIDDDSKDKAYIGIERLKRRRSQIQAVTHVDYSARIQTVHKETNFIFYDLLKSFKKATGVPILVNTSFNVRGEPIVNTVADAFKCFMGTEMDLLVVGNFILKKNKQDAALAIDYRNQFEQD